MTTAITRTRTIAGHTLTLTEGRCYLASRPMLGVYDRTADVSIVDITDGYTVNYRPVVVLQDLPRESADELIRQFNNGETSFAGRVW